MLKLAPRFNALIFVIPPINAIRSPMFSYLGTEKTIVIHFPVSGTNIGTVIFRTLSQPKKVKQENTHYNAYNKYLKFYVEFCAKIECFKTKNPQKTEKQHNIFVHSNSDFKVKFCPCTIFILQFVQKANWLVAVWMGIQITATPSALKDTSYITLYLGFFILFTF